MDSSLRPRRISQKKETRLELLKRIREAKERGERFVVETEEKPVYETVDEQTYAKIVQERIEDDWIVDDGGFGYADDGREIFDDHDGDLEEDESHNKSHRSSTSSKKRANPDIRSSVSTKGGSKDIRSMFSTSASRQKKRIMDAGTEDAALDDLLAELDTDIQSERPLKKLKVDKPRKSLPIKSVSQPQAVVAKPRRETSHFAKSRPPQSQPSTTPRPRNPYSVKSQPTEILVTKPSPVNQKTITTTEQNSEPMEDDFEDHDFPVAETDEVQHSPEKELESDIPAITNWLNEEGGDVEASFVEIDDSENSTAIDESGALRFFWLDAYEDVKNQQGVVFLFGKIPCKDDLTGFCSCCVRMKDLERRIFFLPRPDSQYTVKDVYGELRELSGQWKIGKFKCKPAIKKYCFDLADVPSECEYLEVRYSATYPSLPSDLTGKTFSRVFGTSASFLENLILDLKLRGPCWLEIKGAVPLQPQLSWCKVDYDFSSQHPNKITKLADVMTNPPPAPPIRMVVLDVKSVVRKKSNSAEIISVGVLIDNHFYLDRPAGKKVFQSHYLVLAPPKDSVLPYDLSRRMPTWGPQYQAPSTGAENALLGGVDVEPNERALLGRLLTRIHKLDPDLIIGHDLWGNQLDLLVHRLISHKVAHWHRIGRLRRSAHFTVSFNRTWFMRHTVPGRLVCDTRISSRELVRSRTYNLSELTFQILGSDVKSRRHVPAPVARQFASSTTAALFSGKAPVAAHDIDEALISGDRFGGGSADLRCLFLTASGVKDLIDFCLSDALLVLRLAHQLQVMPLASQITSICGNVLSRTLAGGRSERNDALLLHAFTEQGYLPPESALSNRPQRGRSAKDDFGDPQDEPHEGRRKPAYTGGLVLDPKIGFYDTYILLLDFNSLYPSIIQEFNLCFTTMERSFFAAKDNTEYETADNEDAYISELISSVTQTSGSKPSENSQRLPTSHAPGILPTEVRRLVESRKEVKKLIASASANDTTKVAQWNIRQQALKITANSVYGCLGFGASRFCARGLAALVTGLGRALLMNTKELVENMKLDVIYGDTDSIMVNTNSTDLLSALTIGERVKHEVNRRYRLVELDTDGVFVSMLLLAKKKYAALSITRPLQYAEWLKQQPQSNLAALPPPPTKPEMKGLDIVRRDWCRLAAEVGKFCVNTLLSGRATSEIVIQTIHDHLRNVAQQVRDGTLPKTDFVITKMLTKNPEDYPDAKSQPHVQVALRFNQTTGSGGGHRFRAGDTVEYIICEDGTTRSAVQRAYSPAELSSGIKPPENGEESKNQEPRQLKVDIHYYLASQIHPVVSRLVAPIEGTSPAHVADCLGLDSASYLKSMAVSAVSSTDANEDALQEASDSGSMFQGAFLNDADPLTILCTTLRDGKRCQGKALIRSSPFTQAGLATWVCPDCGKSLLSTQRQAAAAINALLLQARAHIAAYEVGTLICEDPACALATRAISCPPSAATGAPSEGSWVSTGVQLQQHQPLCPLCGAGHSVMRPRHSEIQLYRQLLFYRHLLSPCDGDTRIEKKPNDPDAASNLLPIVRDTLESGLHHIRRYLDQSAFAMVDLGQIFAGLRVLPSHNSQGIGSATTVNTSMMATSVTN
nr:DNA polymerase alpha catalytic subunit [Hymenolepis microstoma]